MSLLKCRNLTFRGSLGKVQILKIVELMMIIKDFHHFIKITQLFIKSDSLHLLVLLDVITGGQLMKMFQLFYPYLTFPVPEIKSSDLQVNPMNT